MKICIYYEKLITKKTENNKKIIISEETNKINYIGSESFSFGIRKHEGLKDKYSIGSLYGTPISKEELKKLAIGILEMIGENK